MSKYLSEVLLVQLLATYLVILGHSYPFITEIPVWLQKTQIFIYCFHMPLFVFISGYLLVYTSQSLKNSASEFIHKRFLKLIIPYLALSVIALLPKFFVQQYLNDSFNLDAGSLLRVFFIPRENIWGHFWFLPMIFFQGICGFILDKIFVRLKIRETGWIISTIILFVIHAATYRSNLTPWLSISDLAKFSWLFSLGCLCGSINLIERIKIKHALWIASALFVAALVSFMIADQWNLNVFVSALIAILMIIALLMICIHLARKINFDKNAIYAQTFTIFLLSWPCQILINISTERILHCPYYIIMPLQFSAGIIGPIILIRIINYIEHKYNLRWISFLLGK